MNRLNIARMPGQEEVNLSALEEERFHEIANRPDMSELDDLLHCLGVVPVSDVQRQLLQETTEAVQERLAGLRQREANYSESDFALHGLLGWLTARRRKVVESQLIAIQEVVTRSADGAIVINHDYDHDKKMIKNANKALVPHIKPQFWLADPFLHTYDPNLRYRITDAPMLPKLRIMKMGTLRGASHQ